jgi:hypothetical protein
VKQVEVKVEEKRSKFEVRRSRLGKKSISRKGACLPDRQAKGQEVVK